MPPVREEKLEPARAYLRLSFQDWELEDRWDWEREANTYRLYRHRQPIYLLKVSRELLDDNLPAQITAILEQSRVAEAMQQAEGHRILLTSNGMQAI